MGVWIVCDNGCDSGLFLHKSVTVGCDNCDNGCDSGQNIVTGVTVKFARRL